jgi:hypothetical protein
MDPILLPEAAPAATPAAKIRGEFDLPYSGVHVVVLRGTGRDQRIAAQAAGRKADPFRLQYAIAAQLCLFDGKKKRMEDFDELDLDDANYLLMRFMELTNPPKAKAAATETPDATEASDSQLSE